MDLVSIKRQTNESIDEYLNWFRQMKARCLTQVPEHELVQMAAGGLEYSTIKKLIINQQLRDMAQLAERVRQIEQLRQEKEKNKRFEKQGFDFLAKPCDRGGKAKPQKTLQVK